MNILDENIIDSQRQLLRSWRLAVRQIGHDIGKKGLKDTEIIPFLHSLAKRMGTVLRVSHAGIMGWRLHTAQMIRLDWYSRQ